MDNKIRIFKGYDLVHEEEIEPVDLISKYCKTIPIKDKSGNVTGEERVFKDEKEIKIEGVLK